VPRSNSPQGRTGRPPLTSRAQILEGARRVIDRDGWEKLTVRRLAAELGIGATTVYHHVKDREDLLILLINEKAAQTPRPELPADPRGRIIVAATAIHDTLGGWPWAAEVLTADGFIARLDEPALWMAEAILDGALECGCTRAQAVDVFRNLWYYTIGEIFVRASSSGRPVPKTPFFDGIDESELPHLAAVGDEWPVLASRDIYPEGLRAFVEGLLSQALPEAS